MHRFTALTFALALATPVAAQQLQDGTAGFSPDTGRSATVPPQPRVTTNGRSTTVVLTAIDGKCISPPGSNWNDNRFRAYWNSSTDYVDGFIKFDLSSIPDTSNITSMTLRAYHEFGFGNPRDNPEVVVHRVDDDSWTRGATDPHPGLNEALTPAITGFPSADLVPVDFGLDVNAASWGGDLQDDRLSLALHNAAGLVGRYSYVYFYSSDASPAPPELTVVYDSGGPSLSVSNLVAGSVTTLSVSGATAGGAVGIAYSLVGGGPSSVGAGPCGTITADLSLPVTVVGILTADAAGNASLTQPVPAGTTGVSVWLQALDIGSCTLTNGLAEVIG